MSKKLIVMLANPISSKQTLIITKVLQIIMLYSLLEILFHRIILQEFGGIRNEGIIFETFEVFVKYHKIGVIILSFAKLKLVE